MKENAKCFIKIKKGIYEEITYKELKERKDKYITYRKKKFVKIGESLLEVTKKEYKLIETDKDRLRYIYKIDRKLNLFSYDKEDEEGNTYKEIIPDKNSNIESEIERKMELERLKEALLKLDDEEYMLIKALYYEQKSLREYGKIINKHWTTIETNRDKILEKIKKFMKI